MRHVFRALQGSYKGLRGRESSLQTPRDCSQQILVHTEVGSTLDEPPKGRPLF